MAGFFLTIIWNLLLLLTAVVVVALLLRTFGRGLLIGAFLMGFGLVLIGILAVLIAASDLFFEGCTLSQALVLHRSIGCSPVPFTAAYSFVLAGFISMLWEVVAVNIIKKQPRA